MRNNFFIILLSVLLLLPLRASGRSVDSVEININEPAHDPMRQALMDELDFIIDRIENGYVSGRRGIGDKEWVHSLNELRSYAEETIGMGNHAAWWAWRYFSLLIDDNHFEFPDDGSFSRHKLMFQDGRILPLWVQIWKDGSIYNVHDYTGIIPQYSEIISISTFYNGQRIQTYKADALGRDCLSMTTGEPVFAFANGNTYNQPDVAHDWMSFANYLSGFSIPPWEVVYKAPDKGNADTVIMQGLTRAELHKLFRKTGNKRLAEDELGFSRKPIVYTNLGNGTGVLTINSFWGKRWSTMLLLGKDWRYKRLLKKAMRRIEREGIENLIIDISLNSGGMAENVYHTLDYFTDRPADIIHTYLINEESREKAKVNIENSLYIAEVDREYLINYIDSIPSGTRFRTDTVRPMRYFPQKPKYRYKGNVYILTSHHTYSAAQMFARYCQVLNIGPIAGQHCGGYNAVTGNAVKVELPASSWMEFLVPFREEVASLDDEPYAYPQVDIPIDHTFEEWLRRENHSLERLMEMISRESKNLAR